jgi:hypothetical protein
MTSRRRRLFVLFGWLTIITIAILTWWSLKHGGTGFYSGP